MLTRCRNPNTRNFNDYGGRGIAVCGSWLAYENFLADMGECPAGMTIERIDNGKGYCPENCRWATLQEQQKNKRSTRLITFNGKTLCAMDWAKALGINYFTLIDRLDAGWPEDRALTAPVRSR